MHSKNFIVGSILQTCQPTSFIPARLVGAIDIYLDFGLGSPGQQYAEVVRYIFLHSSRLMRMKVGIMLKLFSFDVVISLKSESVLIKRNKCCFMLRCFRLGTMVNISAELNILILILVTLAFIQDHRDTGKQKFMCLVSERVLNQFY